ncbi:Predicted membrane protein [Variovorax sp. HW608]|uniref:TPM domain-containing protein n=1 Tax=Variovorax sp. HW608 TaxID=1034889 RepID=UPI00081F7939|nr:TPM domain-containing protein [Variovorax sp. HW608]SCK20669.1 Predicted membrane protein [Variovorax sp. HW608]
MSIARLVRHLCTTHWRARRAFPRKTLRAIERAIHDAETTHTGRIHFVVEAAMDGLPLLRGQSARERAIDLFSHLRLWDTEDNSGVLIYVLLADRQVEIIADRGIHGHVGAAGWGSVCRHMEAAFALGQFESGTVQGVREVAEHLSQHCPADGHHRQERPLIL